MPPAWEAGTSVGGGRAVNTAKPFSSLPEGGVAAVRGAARAALVVPAAGGLRPAAGLDAALWLATHHRAGIGALAGRAAQRLSGDDKRGARRYSLGDAVDGLLGNGDTVEGGFRALH